MRKQKTGKRILSVKIKTMVDDDADTSYLGEYSNRPKTEYAIDRAHSEDCAAVNPHNEEGSKWLGRIRDRIEEHVCEEHIHATDENCDDCKEEWTVNETINTLSDLQDSLCECDCGERGDMQRHEYRYFNGVVENYKGETPENIRKYVRQDYDRMESLNAGHWYYLGIRAEAEVIFGVDPKAKDAPRNRPNFCFTSQKITSGGLWGIESDSKEAIAETRKDELANLKTELLALGFSKRAISKAFEDVQEVDS